MVETVSTLEQSPTPPPRDLPQMQDRQMPSWLKELLDKEPYVLEKVNLENKEHTKAMFILNQMAEADGMTEINREGVKADKEYNNFLADKEQINWMKAEEPWDSVYLVKDAGKYPSFINSYKDDLVAAEIQSSEPQEANTKLSKKEQLKKQLLEKNKKIIQGELQKQRIDLSKVKVLEVASCIDEKDLSKEKVGAINRSAYKQLLAKLFYRDSERTKPLVDVVTTYVTHISNKKDPKYNQLDENEVKLLTELGFVQSSQSIQYSIDDKRLQTTAFFITKEKYEPVMKQRAGLSSSAPSPTSPVPTLTA